MAVYSDVLTTYSSLGGSMRPISCSVFWMRAASMGWVAKMRATVPGCFRSSDSSFSKMLMAPLGYGYVGDRDQDAGRFGGNHRFQFGRFGLGIVVIGSHHLGGHFIARRRLVESRRRRLPVRQGQIGRKQIEDLFLRVPAAPGCEHNC